MDISTRIQELADDDGNVAPIKLADVVGVRAQMVYNYISSGRIPHVVNEEGLKRVPVDDATMWAQGYLSRKVELANKRAEKLAAELNGGVPLDDEDELEDIAVDA